MKKNKKVKGIIAGFALSAVFFAGAAFAQESMIDSLKTQLAQLKQEQSALHEQVLSGEITKEEAQSQMQSKVEALREMKDVIFEERLSSVEEKMVTLSEKNPERAEALLTFMGELKTNRNEMKQKRTALRTSLKAGEMNREQVQESRAQIRESFKTGHLEARQELKDTNTALREGFQQKQAERFEQKGNKPLGDRGIPFRDLE